MRPKWFTLVAPLIAATLALVSCAAPAPTPVVQVVTKEVPKEVVVTQEVRRKLS
jgi:hypothetical protein